MMKMGRNRVFSEFAIPKKVRSVNGQPNWTSFLEITVLRFSKRQTTLFARSIKSKLPKLIKLDTDIEMRQYDRTTEIKKKRHPDSEWYVNHWFWKGTRYWSRETSQRRRTICLTILHQALNLTWKGQYWSRKRKMLVKLRGAPRFSRPSR